MDNGNRSYTHQYPTGELVPFAPNTIVTPEDYRKNLERLQKMKDALNFYEEQNNHGLQRFYAERQALEASVEQGRLAAQRLAELNAAPVLDAYPAPPVPIAGPSNGVPPPLLPSYQAGPQTFNEVEVPTSARIVEITSPQVDSHAESGPSRANRYYRAEANYNGTEPHQRPVQQPQRFHPHQYTNTVPRASTSTSAGTSNPRVFTAPISNAHQMSYEAAALRQNISNAMYDSRGIPQVPQPAYVPYAPPLYTAPPFAPQPALSQDTSRQTQASQASQASYQPSRANQSAPEAPRPSNPPQQSDNTYQEQQLFAFFRSLKPVVVQQLMVQVLTIVARMQSGRPKTAAEEEIDNSLDVKMRQASEVIAGKLKQYSVVEIKKIFVKYLNISKTGREQAEMYSANIRDAAQAEQAATAQPTASTSAQPAQNAAAPQTATASNMAQPRPAPPFSSASSASTSTAIPSTSSTTAVPSTSSVPAGTASSSSASQTSGTRIVAASDHPQLQWYVPKDPSAPIAYRDGTGKICYVFRPQQAPVPISAPSITTNPPAMPSLVHPRSDQQAQVPQMTTVELPGTPEPVEIHPPSSWSPENADRSRLAQDIMRSLGRPRGSFGEPLVSASASPVLPTSSGPPFANGKRKSPPSPRPSTPLKKHRAEEPDDATITFAIPPADVIDLTSSTPEEGTPVEPMRTTPEPEAGDTVAEPARDPSEDLGDGAVTLPPLERETSVVSSESIDVDKVQAMFSELVGASSGASDPPSSVKSPSPPAQASEMVDLPSLDEALFAADSTETVNTPFEASTPFHPASDSERTTSPARSNKVPLFLPSPSSSPVASGSSRGASQSASDDDMISDSEAAPRPLYGHRNKGKGKATQHSVDIDLTTSPGSGSHLSPRKSQVFIEVPPLPRYARQLREAVQGLTTASGSTSGGEDSVDELAEWHEEEDRKTHEEEMRAVVQLSYDRMRESPCLWSGCGAVLNSMSRLQEHAAQHACEHMEWGTYGCQWQNCTLKFTQEAKLAQHLRKHGRLPLPCTYDGCEKTYNTAEALLAHHKSSRHRTGTLRASTAPSALAQNQRPLSPLPDVLPAYMSIPRRVSRHPISKERHQWLGPKVLENITAFKYSGGRSNAALPPRGSRRLAEKVAAAELADVSPEAALEQIKRWMDDEYLAFADGYDAARRPGLRCADVPSQEVTQLVDAGLVLWPGEDDQKAEARARAHGRADKDASPPSALDAGASGDDGGGADDSEDSGVDQLADDVSDGQLEEGGTGTGRRAGGGRKDAGGRVKLKLKLPRRSKVGIDASAPGVALGTELGVKREDEEEGPDGGVDLDLGGGIAPQSSPSRTQSSPSHAQQHIPWPIWPPAPDGSSSVV